MTVLLDHSGIGSKALANGNSQANAFREFAITNTKPSGDGIYTAGDGGEVSHKAIAITPYCNSADASFKVRVFGWFMLQRAPATGAALDTWYPILLQEFACMSGRIDGGVRQPPHVEVGHIVAGEFLCGDFTPVYADCSEVLSRGVMIGVATVKLRGCRLFEFDFEQTDPVAMNAIWHRF